MLRVMCCGFNEKQCEIVLRGKRKRGAKEHPKSGESPFPCAGDFACETYVGLSRDDVPAGFVAASEQRKSFIMSTALLMTSSHSAVLSDIPLGFVMVILLISHYF